MLSLHGVTWTHKCPIYFFKTLGVHFLSSFFCISFVVSMSFNWTVTIHLVQQVSNNLLFYLLALHT